MQQCALASFSLAKRLNTGLTFSLSFSCVPVVGESFTVLVDTSKRQFLQETKICWQQYNFAGVCLQRGNS